MIDMSTFVSRFVQNGYLNPCGFGPTVALSPCVNSGELDPTNFCLTVNYYINE